MTKSRTSPRTSAATLRRLLTVEADGQIVDVIPGTETMWMAQLNDDTLMEIGIETYDLDWPDNDAYAAETQDGTRVKALVFE